MIKVFLRGETFRVMLARAHISQNEFAAMIGFTSGYMSQMIAGDRSLSAATRRKIMEHFIGNSFDDLFEIVDRKD